MYGLCLHRRTGITRGYLCVFNSDWNKVTVFLNTKIHILVKWNLLMIKVQYWVFSLIVGTGFPFQMILARNSWNVKLLLISLVGFDGLTRSMHFASFQLMWKFVFIFCVCRTVLGRVLYGSWRVGCWLYRKCCKGKFSIQFVDVMWNGHTASFWRLMYIFRLWAVQSEMVLHHHFSSSKVSKLDALLCLWSYWNLFCISFEHFTACMHILVFVVLFCVHFLMI